MRTIDRSTAFKRDYKRAQATPRYRKGLDSLVSAVLALLLTDGALPEAYRDHALAGDWADIASVI
jgi:mRNA interferase YafQ